MRAMILLATAAALLPAGTALAAPKLIPNQYICTFDGSVSRGNVRAEADKAANPSLGQLLHVYDTALKGFAVRMPIEPGGRSQVARLKQNNPKVAACEQDQLMSVDVKGKPGGGNQPAEVVDWGVARVGGPGTAVAGRTAWVIDTGIQLNHPDLNVDSGRSRSFVSDPSPNDGNGHGTHVAGTIGAIDNNIGVVGVAPGARLVAVRVLGTSGSGTNSGVIAGVNYVAANGANGDVANMSLGGGVSAALDSAVISAAANGISFTLAAGNSAADANTSSPARANGPNVYTVSAFSRTNDTFASFSNFGNPPVDYAEPGVSIRSTYKGSGYATLSGTSMAAPHLAGILMAGNSVGNGGTVNGDPDGNPDKIGIR
jgi:subtilisin family serine protease